MNICNNYFCFIFAQETSTQKHFSEIYTIEEVENIPNLIQVKLNQSVLHKEVILEERIN